MKRRRFIALGEIVLVALALATVFLITLTKCSSGEPGPVECVEGGDPGSGCLCVGGVVMCGLQPASADVGP